MDSLCLAAGEKRDCQRNPKVLRLNILAAFLPVFYDNWLILAGIGGIFFMAAYLLIGLKLFRLGQAGSPKREG